jgi:hypothetical protein
MAAFANAFALARFGFHFGHFSGRGGNSGFLFLIGLAFTGVLIWAITRPARNGTQSN